ncbi:MULTISPECIES: folate-binding protein YgfZ [unclassified Achromobacter]|uniref:CAF17-like 4Fe-4S cluster assembly/insertion protein YgfZ n=1 Tax=unclassified Achromobacter TaxID=2626865 RepID=UPI000B5170B8|nr:MULTISPECIES: folate-binding protein YgfZ [unclassified Achromobacter]OWT80029.1 folate-binding protein YgfZ [Achromobacter sp. HZ34]OWT81912.1 folate-binding protein YgfZ [Achromobacter sp. HZ28]
MHAFFEAIPDSAQRLAQCAPLPDLQVISASGADAISFLHGQLTQDLTGLDSTRAALAGYCTAKGRLLATMVMWREAESAEVHAPVGGGAAGAAGTAVAAPGAAAVPAPAVFHALVRADVAAALVKRLSMFVLRAKAKIAVTPLRVAAVWGVTDIEALGRVAGGELPRAAWQRANLPSGTWIAAPGADAADTRWWWIASDAQLDRLESPDGALLNSLALGDAEHSRAADLAAGVPWVGTSTQDMFIPQTVNLDLVGGVSFTKGCYPGQEVVARSHYRGTVKRRMAYGVVAGVAAGGVAPGTDVYDAAQPNEPCGRVVDAAGTPDAAILFETTLAALETGGLRLGTVDGAAIEVRPLPYSFT